VTKNVLITGGAGFIASHLADDLLSRGYRVRALDNLSSQVHGSGETRPAYLSSEVELVSGDVRDPVAVQKALTDVDAVYHFAAAVGVGQSMYQITHYTQVNNLGTAVLLEALIRRPVSNLIVASSMSLYGEGLYVGRDGTTWAGVERTAEQLRAGDWDPKTPSGEPLAPVPTPESKPPSAASIYALGKYDQEKMCLLVGEAYGIATVALRFFNVYGPRQALSNPYTGALAIFAARLLNASRPLIYEDGKQRRDFVYVSDAVMAARLALEVESAKGQAFNIGSGQHYAIGDIAERMAKLVGREDLQPIITGEYRVGDIRHCYADISLARRGLGYEPMGRLDVGLTQLATWLDGQVAADGVDLAHQELRARGLTR
jgi:dTDP-L-rhamnose 4-epimerase